jgi:adenosylcobinamide-GDP ribazoletransferase
MAGIRRQIDGRVAELVAAFGLLTRLPLPRGIEGAPSGRAVWAWPVVGAVVGAIGAVVFLIVARLGLAPWLSALSALAATVLVTGGLHEDGLADMADGVGGGGTAERRLAIMKDSRIGSFGALALIFSVALRAGALATIAMATAPGAVAGALVLAGVIGRAGMLVPFALLSPARPGGLGAMLGRLEPIRAGIAVAIAVVLALLLRPVATVEPMLVAAVVAAALVTWIARRRLGGHTGDVLGAAEQVTECAVLLALSASFGGLTL